MPQKPSKQGFEALREEAQGPWAVRTLGRVGALGIGPRVRRTYQRWHERTRLRRYEQGNAGAREAFQRNRPTLTPTQERLVRRLGSHGIASAGIRDLLGADAWWTTLSAAADRWLASDDVLAREREWLGQRAREIAGAAKRKLGKGYLIRMFGRDAPMAWDSPWLRFAVEPAVLDVANAYLALFSKIIYVDVWNTVPLTHDGPDVASQRWHRDPEDRRLLKVFLYLRDVPSGAGPLQYVPRSRPGEQYGDFWPQQSPAGSVPPEGAVEAGIPEGDREVCAYPAGTLVFVDTVGLHRGGRADEERRVVATWTYTTHASLWARAFALDRTAVPDDLTDAARFALLSPDDPPGR